MKQLWITVNDWFRGMRVKLAIWLLGDEGLIANCRFTDDDGAINIGAGRDGVHVWNNLFEYSGRCEFALVIDLNPEARWRYGAFLREHGLEQGGTRYGGGPVRVETMGGGGHKNAAGFTEKKEGQG